MGSETGWAWDHTPPRIHAAREVMNNYDVRRMYAIVAACPREPNRVVHCRRHDAE